MSILTTEYRHTPVLLSECLEQLNPETKHTFVDATLGGAGHSLQVAKRLADHGLLIGIDQDEQALAAARSSFEAQPKSKDLTIKLLHGNFGELDNLLLTLDIPGVDAFLFDIGLSSYQIDTPSRGFSFKEMGPLDMRMDPGKQTITAKEIINTYNAADLTRILRDYGEERWASRIAQFICEARKKSSIENSQQLVNLIKAAIPASARRAGGHPAKRTFQALRIEVNNELEVLERALKSAISWLNPQGRVAVISYHSLEDRIVKKTFHRYAHPCICPPDLPVCVCGRKPIIKEITKAPIVPTSKEVESNPRARSAKLRVAERL